MLFQPGDTKSVTLVRIGGKQVIRGGNGIVDGPVHDANIIAAMDTVCARAFGNFEETHARFRKLLKHFSVACVCICFLLSSEARISLLRYPLLPILLWIKEVPYFETGLQ